MLIIAFMKGTRSVCVCVGGVALPETVKAGNLILCLCTFELLLVPAGFPLGCHQLRLGDVCLCDSEVSESGRGKR